MSEEYSHYTIGWVTIYLMAIGCSLSTKLLFWLDKLTIVEGSVLVYTPMGCHIFVSSTRQGTPLNSVTFEKAS